MALLLGIEIGPTSLKTTLLDGGGQVLARTPCDYSTHHPFPGWLEQSPKTWWDGLQATVHEVSTRAGIVGDPIDGISMSSMIPVLVGLAVGVFRDVVAACVACVQPSGVHHLNSEWAAVYDELFPICASQYGRSRESFQAIAMFRHRIHPYRRI